MDATTFRRYLQPSPTLRWHPWAPLACLALALVTAFAIGARFGYSYAVARTMHPHTEFGFVAMVRAKEQVENPALAALREVRAMDGAVHQWVHREPPRDPWIRAASLVDRKLNKSFANESMQASVAKIAEFRLREFAPDSSRWSADANWCRTTHAIPGPPDRAFEQAALDYSRLLGRPITAKQLAPAIPGGECKGGMQ